MNKMNICGKEVDLDGKYLRLHDSQLTSLPIEIGNLEKLEYLNLSDEHLTSLPAEIGNLKTLEYLNLDNK